MEDPTIDKFFFIMDHSNHYYKLDTANQLVVATDENEASVFSYDEANEKIGTKSKSKFYSMVPIETSNKTDEELIQEIDEIVAEEEEELKSLKKIEEEEDEVEEAEEESYDLAEVIESELQGTETTSENVEELAAKYVLSEVNWQEYLSNFIIITSGLREYREGLAQARYDIDQKICDILHYIELCNTDDSKAKDLVRLLKACRENRRNIKDEIIRVDMFHKTVGTRNNLIKAKEALRSIKGLDTRQYTPRKFTELFEDSQVKIESNIDSKPTDYYEKEHNNIEKYEIQEKLVMSYERKETSFDGKENDWLTFARQQAEFYKNAGQHIINLKIDIEEIDKAIAGLMIEIENANCNAVQGYKFFKELKDLRLERKEKEKELECLYILTEHFDLPAMADECDSDVRTLEKILHEEPEKLIHGVPVCDIFAELDEL